MKLKLVPPRQGAVWVRQGLAIFFRRPLAFCVLFLVYMFKRRSRLNSEE